MSQQPTVDSVMYSPRFSPAAYAIMIGAIVLAGPSTESAAQESLGVLVSIHSVTLKADADADAFEQLYREKVRPFWQKYYPGCTLTLLRGERQAEPGAYIQMVRCDSKSIRDLYWPEPGTPSDAARAENERSQKAGDALDLGDMTEYQGFVDYIVVG